MKYALIQMPDSTILIVDNRDNIGKCRACRLIDEGGKPVGIIESDLHVGTLQSGFQHQRNLRLDELYDRIRLAEEVLDGDVTFEQVHPIPEVGNSC
jgi:hypothetical protein